MAYGHCNFHEHRQYMKCRGYKQLLIYQIISIRILTLKFTTVCIPYYSKSLHFKFILNLGTCNNLEKPLFGAAFMPLARLKEPVYDDKMAAPVGTYIIF
uniref:Uncharacterized protein n=1 Tax=Meloidogyne incognita TaxID=6306 RepID=A0A914LFL2_MELIC